MSRNEVELDETSRPSMVLRCCINAITQLSDNEYIYDDDGNINILVTDAQMVVTNLRRTEALMDRFKQWMLDGRLSVEGITDDEVKEVLR